MLDRFSWKSYDLNTCLPSGWKNHIIEASGLSDAKVLLPRSVTSREGNPDLQLSVLTLDGIKLKERLPWLFELYRTIFRDLAQLGSSEPVRCASQDVYAAVLNVQRGSNMRYETHVDSNPIEGLLYVTTHPKGSGGELVVANVPAANSVSEIDTDCSTIYPVEGNLVFFDARRFPHYVRHLNGENDVRVVVAMNFYTPSCPESARPQDLSTHLFGYSVSVDNAGVA